MPGSAVVTVDRPFSEVTATARANGEILIQPATRLVVETANLPAADAGIDAKWSTTITSRSSAAGITTEIAEVSCLVDLDGGVTAESFNTAGAIIGDDGVAASLGQYTVASMGTVIGGTMTCLETPGSAGGQADNDIDLQVGSTADRAANTAVTGTPATLVERGGNWAAGETRALVLTDLTANDYFYLVVGDGVPTGEAYTAGKFLIKFICQYAVPS